MPTLEWLTEMHREPVGCFIEHRDGLRTTMLMLNSLIQDFTYAGMVRDSGRVISCQMHLPMPMQNATTANFFNPLVHHIEQMVLTGKSPYPVQRTLLTSGMTLFGVESLSRGGARVETPEMNVTYQVANRSTYWRD